VADLDQAPEFPAPRRTPRAARWARSALLSLATLYCGVALGFYLFQDGFILFPDRRLPRTPASLGLGFSETYFPSADGLRLHGWYVPAAAPRAWPEASRPVVLFCHGNAGNIATRLDVIAALHGLGYDVFSFDYRGFGRSAVRHPDETGLYGDVQGAWEYLTRVRGIPPKRLVVYGQSLGCGAASWLTAHRPAGALVLEGAFPSLARAASPRFGWLPLAWLLRERYPTVEHLRLTVCPVLVAHSPADRIVPFRFGREVFAAAREPKEFLTLSGDHVEAWSRMPGEYAAVFDRFVRRSLR